MVVLGTDDGIWVADGAVCERMGLEGRRVTHVSQRAGVILGTVPNDGLYLLCDRKQKRAWQGDARSCAVGPDGSLWVGSEPAMVHRLDARGGEWVRCDAIDSLPTRGDWTFPPPPHEPHVLSIDFLPEAPGSVLAGVEVGGVLLSADRGESWSELNDGVYADVHSVRPVPGRPAALAAVTGAGFYASEDGGRTWQRRMERVGRGYTIGMQLDPERSGHVLVTSGDRPPGLNARVYHSQDLGHTWQELSGQGLPDEMRRAPVPLFTEGRAWLATDTGRLLSADDARGAWELAGELPTRINALAREGASSSVMH